MANPLTRFLNSRFIQPAVEAVVEKALASERPPAYGASVLPELTLEQTGGQPHDANYALLYALYKLNTDVSGCVPTRGREASPVPAGASPPWTRTPS